MISLIVIIKTTSFFFTIIRIYKNIKIFLDEVSKVTKYKEQSPVWAFFKQELTIFF